MFALFKKQPIVSSAFLLATAVTLYFGIKLVADMVYWADPAHRNQAPAEWMTPGYVSHSWKVDREDLRDFLDYRRDDIKGRPTLKRIAETKGMPVETLIAQLETYLKDAR